MEFYTSYNNQEQKTLDNLREFELELKQKKKKLDQKTKFKKALRGIKNNQVKTSHGHNVHGSLKTSKTSKGSNSDVSFMYAMVLAIVSQMNTNLKSMGAQAQHVQLLDQNNATFNTELLDLQVEGNGITDYTSENSLITSSDVSSKMNILGNQMTQNQENEMKDTGVAQGLQTNNGSESSLGQSMLDLDKQIFKQVHLRKG